MSGARRVSRWGRGACGCVFVLALSLSACSSESDRAQEHLHKANEYLASGLLTEATLEYQSALRFDPRSVEANNRLAEIEINKGNLSGALAYMQEAYRLDPTDADAALHLASLLRSDQPDSAEALVEGVIEREPENPHGYVGRSHVALARGQIREAVLAARKAMEVAPDDPEADWNYGHVLQAMIREGQLRGEPAADNIYTEALHGFERYVAKGGERPWKAQLEEARILAAWPTKGRRTAAMFRTAIQTAIDDGPRAAQLSSSYMAAGFARETGQNDLLEFALETIVTVDPRDLHSWRSLSDLHKATGRDAKVVWDRALAATPEEPRLHVEYARFMIHQGKLDEALSYLEDKAREGVDPPLLLSTISSTQIAAGRSADAQATARRLEQEHPDHPRTILSRAQLDMRRGQISKATRALRNLAGQHPSSDLYRLLARAEEVSERKGAALDAINRAIELDPYFRADERRTRARLLAERGKYEGTIRDLVAIRERGQLSDSDRVLLARCRYETDDGVYGRAVLLELLARRRPPIEAILLLSRKESGDPKHASLARRELEKFLRRQPRHWDALGEMTRLDVEAGRGALALKRLDDVFESTIEDVPPPVRLLRARLSAEQGREAGILEDATAAFEARPSLPGALEMVVALQIRGGDVDAATAATEEAQRVGAFSQSRRLLLGQLYRMGGREADALAVFENAVASGSEDPAVYYHMGLALRSLNRSDEATRAFEKALSISTSFPEADDAQRALEGTRSVGAS